MECIPGRMDIESIDGGIHFGWETKMAQTYYKKESSSDDDLTVIVGVISVLSWSLQ